MKHRLAGLLVVLTIAATVVVGCGSSGASSSNSTASSSATHAAAGTNTGQHVLGIVKITSTDLSTVQATQGATKAASQAGWGVVTADAQGEPAKAIAAIQDFVTRHVSAIMVTVFQSSSLEAGIRAAAAAHIPVVSMAGGLAPGVAAAVDANAGDVVTRGLIKAMGGGGHGSILAFTYHPGLPCLLRGQAFDSVMSGYSGVHVTRHEVNIQGVSQDGQSTTSAWLQTHPTAPLGIFGCYDDPSLGAIAALKAAGVKPGQVKVFGFNAEAPALAAIRSGWMTGSMFYNSTAAGVTVFQTIQKILAAGASWHPVELQIPHELVTAANVGSFANG